MPAEKPASQLRFANSMRSEPTGRESLSVGRDAAAACWATQPQLSAAVEPPATASPNASLTRASP
jgi:hypothetical protein